MEVTPAGMVNVQLLPTLNVTECVPDAVGIVGQVCPHPIVFRARRRKRMRVDSEELRVKS
jgi:hypothetical protein